MNIFRKKIPRIVGFISCIATGLFAVSCHPLAGMPPGTGYIEPTVYNIDKEPDSQYSWIMSMQSCQQVDKNNPAYSSSDLNEAAKAGNAEAQFKLGEELDHQAWNSMDSISFLDSRIERRTPIYNRYAATIWQCAAEQKHAAANYKMGHHYKDTNFQLAYHYFLNGAKYGDRLCLMELKEAYAVSDKKRSDCFANLAGKASFLEADKLYFGKDFDFHDLDKLCPANVPQKIGCSTVSHQTDEYPPNPNIIPKIPEIELVCPSSEAAGMWRD